MNVLFEKVFKRLLTILSKIVIIAYEYSNFIGARTVPCGKKRKRQKMATHKRKKMLRRNRHKSK